MMNRGNRTKMAGGGRIPRRSPTITMPFRPAASRRTPTAGDGLGLFLVPHQRFELGTSWFQTLSFWEKSGRSSRTTPAPCVRDVTMDGQNQPLAPTNSRTPNPQPHPTISLRADLDRVWGGGGGGGGRASVSVHNPHSPPPTRPKGRSAKFYWEMGWDGSVPNTSPDGF